MQVAFGAISTITGAPQGYSKSTAQTGTNKCPEGQILKLDGSCATPSFSKSLYAFVSPKRKNVPIIREEIEIPKPEIEHSVVFIKSPEPPTPPEPIIIAPPQQKTSVYVLTKQKNLKQRVFEAPEPQSSPPEVIYVNYNEGEYPDLPINEDLDEIFKRPTQGKLISVDSNSNIDKYETVSSINNKENNIFLKQIFVTESNKNKIESSTPTNIERKLASTTTKPKISTTSKTELKKLDFFVPTSETIKEVPANKIKNPKLFAPSYDTDRVTFNPSEQNIKVVTDDFVIKNPDSQFEITAKTFLNKNTNKSNLFDNLSNISESFLSVESEGFRLPRKINNINKKLNEPKLIKTHEIQTSNLHLISQGTKIKTPNKKQIITKIDSKLGKTNLKNELLANEDLSVYNPDIQKQEVLTNKINLVTTVTPEDSTINTSINIDNYDLKTHNNNNEAANKYEKNKINESDIENDDESNSENEPTPESEVTAK